MIAKLVLILANQIAQNSPNFILQLTFSQQYTFVLFCLHDPAYTLFDASSPCDFNAVSIQFGRGRSVFNFIDAQSYNISIFFKFNVFFVLSFDRMNIKYLLSYISLFRIMRFMLDEMVQ